MIKRLIIVIAMFTVLILIICSISQISTDNCPILVVNRNRLLDLKQRIELNLPYEILISDSVRTPNTRFIMMATGNPDRNPSIDYDLSVTAHQYAEPYLLATGFRLLPHA